MPQEFPTVSFDFTLNQFPIYKYLFLLLWIRASYDWHGHRAAKTVTAAQTAFLERQTKGEGERNKQNIADIEANNPPIAAA